MKRLVNLLLMFTLLLTVNFYINPAVSQAKEKSVVTIPMSTEAKLMEKQIIQWDDAKLFVEEGYPTLLKAIQRSEKNAFPKVENTLSITKSLIAGSEVYAFENEKAESVVLYIHGGAYTFGITSLHVKTCEKLAQLLNAVVYMPLYPLTPQSTYKDAYDFMDAVYAKLLAKGKTIYIMGDSAGGGFSLAYTQYLKDKKQPLPKKLVLLSPWLDVTMTNPEIKKYEKVDISLKSYGLSKLGDMWAGDISAKNPLISPIYGKVKGLPPIMIMTGTSEVMYPDNTKLYKKLLKAKNDASLVYGEGLWHVFVIYDIPESATSLDLIKKFIVK